jgi:hypothetical protein
MRNLQSNNKGVGLVKTLAIVIIILLVGFIVLYFVKTNNDNKTKNSSHTKSSSKNKASSQAEKNDESLIQAIKVAQEYYQFKYIDNWNTEVPKEQLKKWLDPSLIAQLDTNPRADIGIDPQASGFTKPDEVLVKGGSSDGSSATTQLSLVYIGNPDGGTRHNISLKADNGTWLITGAKINP